MRRFFKVVLFIMILLIGAFLILIAVFAPPLPKEADGVIAQVQANVLPELVQGDTAYVTHDGLRIFYETLDPDDSPKATVVLIMGIGGDGLEWPRYFFEPLLQAGYRVIRYDNRDTGRSDPWQREGIYDLDDMAGDLLAIVDATGADRVHLVGMSMGGMIAQAFAIQYPARTASLTSIMSTGYAGDVGLPPLNRNIFIDLAAASFYYGIFRSEHGTARTSIAARRRLSGNGLSEARMRSLAEISVYKVRNEIPRSMAAFLRHRDAIDASAARWEALARLNMPALVVHGMRDPLIPLAHGQATARAIPGADSLWVRSMGHDLPPEHTKEVTDRFLRLIEQE